MSAMFYENYLNGLLKSMQECEKGISPVIFVKNRGRNVIIV